MVRDDEGTIKRQLNGKIVTNNNCKEGYEKLH